MKKTYLYKMTKLSLSWEQISIEKTSNMPNTLMCRLREEMLSLHYTALQVLQSFHRKYTNDVASSTH